MVEFESKNKKRRKKCTFHRFPPFFHAPATIAVPTPLVSLSPPSNMSPPLPVPLPVPVLVLAVLELGFFSFRPPPPPPAATWDFPLVPPLPPTVGLPTLLLPLLVVKVRAFLWWPAVLLPPPIAAGALVPTAAVDCVCEKSFHFRQPSKSMRACMQPHSITFRSSQTKLTG